MSYDYLVVGTGSAGAALAARLSENSSAKVLLLEAGPDYRSADAPPEMRSPNFAEIVRLGVMQPFSRGLLTIRSPDPSIDPRVDFHLLTDQRDLQRLREGLRLTLRLTQQIALSGVSEGILATGLSDDLLSNNEFLEIWLRRNCEGFFHAVGACRMGSGNDSGSVVDSDCRVIGVENLRIVDASIIPVPPRAPTHLTTVMIAEHMAARIQASGKASRRRFPAPRRRIQTIHRMALSRIAL